jgi:hypothetical protein
VLPAGLHRSDRCTTLVRPVQVWADRVLVSVLARRLGLVQVVMVLVVGLQVVILLDDLHLLLNTRVEGVIGLRCSGGTIHGLPFVVPPSIEGWFPRSGYCGGVHGGSFDRRDSLDCANPTLEQMDQHWFYTFGTKPTAESFLHSRARF